MADYEAPAGPPPPKVPEGWLVKWNEQYKEWFYVNTITKKSQWEKPTEPAHGPTDDVLDGPPPSYTPGKSPAPSDAKSTTGSSNPFDAQNKAGGSSTQVDDDARLARQLQDEEEARARAHSPSGGGPGAAASYANTPIPGGASSPFPDQLPPRTPEDGKSRGLLGKLFGGRRNNNQGYPGAGYQGQQPYGPPPGPYAQPQYGGGYPPPGGYGPGPGYGPPPGGYYGGGYAPQQQRPSRMGGGLGTAGGAALGLGGGLIGGMLLEDAIHSHDQSIYNQGYNQGEMADHGGGGGYGDGGDFGNGGGGDFGGGDFGGGGF